MEVCNVHDIAFSDRYCPACELQEKVDDLGKEVEGLERQIADAEMEE